MNPISKNNNSDHLFLQRENIGLKLDALPLELFQLILTHLKPDDYQESNTIAKRWNIALINNAKEKDLAAIQKFTEWFCTILENDHSEIQKKLNEVVTGTEIFESMSLLKVKMFDLSEKIILILKQLDFDLLKYLEFTARTEKKPKYFKDLLFLTLNYKKIELEIAHAKPSHLWKKSDALTYLFDELTTNGFYDQALLMMQKLPDDSAKDFIFKIVNKNQKQIQIPHFPHLPFDVITTIFTFLNEETWQKTVAVNKLWSLATIEGVKKTESEKMQSFIKKMADNLDAQPNIKNQLKDASSKSKIIMQSTNLLDIRTLKSFLKENTLNILKNLKVKDLHELNIKLGKSKLFSIAHFYKRIDNALQTPFEDIKSFQLKTICLDMVRTYYFEEAIKVFKKILSDHERDEVLIAISDGLISFGELNKALGVLGSVKDEKTKTSTIKKISDLQNQMKGFKNE